MVDTEGDMAGKRTKSKLLSIIRMEPRAWDEASGMFKSGIEFLEDFDHPDEAESRLAQLKKLNPSADLRIIRNR